MYSSSLTGGGFKQIEHIKAKVYFFSKTYNL